MFSWQKGEERRERERETKTKGNKTKHYGRRERLQAGEKGTIRRVQSASPSEEIKKAGKDGERKEKRKASRKKRKKDCVYVCV